MTMSTDEQERQDQSTGTAQLPQQAVLEYLAWMQTSGYAPSGFKTSERVLGKFLAFAAKRHIALDNLFTWETLSAYQGRRPSTETNRVIKNCARYLFEQKKIPRPLQTNYYHLPAIYGQYIEAYARSHKGPCITLCRVLYGLQQYLAKSNTALSRMGIEQVDACLSKLTARCARSTGRLYRNYVRGFLRYLYQHKIVSRDLAPLVVSPPQFDRANPPKFLRSEELKHLFDSLGQQLSTAGQLRTYAMVHLAYSLGLRPGEISRISLDDLCFVKQQLCLPIRKSANPLTLPVPEETLKAISAYLVGGRPKSNSRRLFLSLRPPCRPLTSHMVSYDISRCMRTLGLPASAYWLRHSYAQSLLEAGTSLYEIKEMMGHGHIESTRRYLSIHTKLMREVLFDETV